MVVHMFSAGDRESVLSFAGSRNSEAACASETRFGRVHTFFEGICNS